MRTLAILALALAGPTHAGGLYIQAEASYNFTPALSPATVQCLEPTDQLCRNLGTLEVGANFGEIDFYARHTSLFQATDTGRNSIGVRVRKQADLW